MRRSHAHSKWRQQAVRLDLCEFAHICLFHQEGCCWLLYGRETKGEEVRDLKFFQLKKKKRYWSMWV